MSILITAASHAEAYKIEKLLNAPEVILADYQDLPGFTIPGKKFISIPAGNSPSYAHIILSICLDYGINTVYPLYQAELKPLAESKKLFAEYGISIIVPSLQWLEDHPKSDVVSFSDLAILENGELKAGVLPTGITWPEAMKTGIFGWIADNNNINFTLFTI
ncbi:MAG TPA: hypothetical protein VEV16_09670 [Daejeonella sp.]|nr:hypothetical protein [Daejeonella sp.]